VRPDFYAAPSRGRARESLDVPVDTPCAVLMGGGWGLGPLVDSARALAAAGVHTLAVAGRNRSAEAALRALAVQDSRVHAFGFTDRVPELMSAADVVVTTAGDTCSESRVIGRRLVLLDVVAGHGRENLQHELELGGAVVASTEPALLTGVVLRALDNGGDPTPDTDRRAAWEEALDHALQSIEDE
jgi:processive 1,2-diacylglycerol beta-glucosyltransferase